ncbi:putative methyltransferase-domain-containing protein [Pyrenochaeta sp. MPI-SDFR-AT-0127]|nr:putative methyltransferase-domain-containing protein [Pyrenochaeta sp. MPI-SDFR-AT-0127]
MRYVRFLKTPRVTTEKNTSKSEVCCLITITSDLGDSFLPYDIQLSAELLSSQPSEHILVWRTVQWTGGMRSLPVTFPLPKSRAKSPLRVRIGVEPKSLYDDYSKLANEGSRGIVSAWSADFGAPVEAIRLIERRFMLPRGPKVHIWEETGESIARHLWDAGITLSCHLIDMLDDSSALSRAILPSQSRTQLQILELGTGCGMVGITLAQVVGGANVLLTDLAEAQEIVEHNVKQVKTAKASSLRFQELDWDQELPSNLLSSSSPLDLVLAADCTYNSDSSPALVRTLARLAQVSPKVIVAIAMKMRHSSEEVFFGLMTKAAFEETTTITYHLPGDVEVGEETVYLHVYHYIAGSR